MKTLLTHCGLLALGVALAGCNGGSNTSSGPSLDTGLSNAGLTMSVTQGDSVQYGYAYFDDSTNIYIPSGSGSNGNPDDLQTISMYNSQTGEIAVTPLASTTPGIYPITIDASDSAGNVSSALFFVYVYSSTGGQYITTPQTLTYPLTANGSATGTLTLGTFNGITNVLNQSVSLSQPAGSTANSGVVVNSITAIPIANTDSASLTANITVDSAKLIGAGTGNACANVNGGNALLMQLTANPSSSNSQNPSPFREYVCVTTS